MGKRIVIALGGNALGSTLPEQMTAVRTTARAIADLIDESELDEQHVITSPFDPRVAPHVAAAVAGAAIKTGVARITDITPDEVAEHTRQLLAAEHASEA